MNRWDRQSIPHKGWECIGMDDLGEFVESGEIEYENCEMCGKERIRYVHIMKHEDGNILRVGSSCAGNMEKDYSESEQRDAEVKRKALRRANFLKQVWNENQKGNLLLTYKGYRITIIKSKYSSYGVAFRNEYFWTYKGRRNLDLSTAKRLAFELFDSL